MNSSLQQIRFDPRKARLDLSPEDAFSLTSVHSLEDYHLLRQRLPEMRGLSYFFINILGSRARLVLTIIVAEDFEVTATFVLDHNSLGISYEELFKTGKGDGNHPLPHVLINTIQRAMNKADWRFFKAA